VSKTYYKASYENKEVWAHADGSHISVEWFINRIKLNKPILSDKYMEEIDDYCSQMLGVCINPETMYKLIHFLEKYLPYLKDDTETNLKYITLNMSADIHRTRWTATKMIRWLRNIFTDAR
jgi:hypothetical protein